MECSPLLISRVVDVAEVEVVTGVDVEVAAEVVVDNLYEYMKMIK